MKIISIAAVVCILATNANAGLKEDLIGETLICDGGSEIQFSANGSSAKVISPGGTSRAVLGWHAGYVEFFFPGAQDSLALQLVGDRYKFQNANCE